GTMTAMLAIDHANVITPRGVIEGHVVVDGDRIVAVEPGPLASPPAGTEVLDLDGAWLSPGFIDLQINGAFGVDVTSEPARIAEIGAGLVAHGVTSFLPTVITAPAARRTEALAAFAALAARPSGAGRGGAVPLGLHFEGPMLSPARLGAHPV